MQCWQPVQHIHLHSSIQWDRTSIPLLSKHVRFQGVLYRTLFKISLYVYTYIALTCLYRVSFPKFNLSSPLRETVYTTIPIPESRLMIPKSVVVNSETADFKGWPNHSHNPESVRYRKPMRVVPSNLILWVICPTSRSCVVVMGCISFCFGAGVKDNVSGRSLQISKVSESMSNCNQRHGVGVCYKLLVPYWYRPCVF